MRHNRFFLMLIAIVAFTQCARAHAGDNRSTDPAVFGFVSDAVSKKPVKGVTILVTSCDHKIVKSVTTDDFGKFSIPALGSAEVTIILEKKGYKTYTRERVVVKDGMPVKLNLDLRNEEKIDENIFHPLLRMLDN